VLIINHWASWSDEQFKIGVIVSFKSKYINENTSATVAEVFCTLVEK